MRARVRQYELIREIGRGGMGTVYLARDTRLARRVAIKFLADTAPAVAQRFLAEARATPRCSHENIVVIHEVDEIEGQPYMVLELLEGRTLRRLLEGGPVAPSRAVELIVPVVRALACARGFGIVHRDLKPENIFVTDAGHVKVLDFGIATLLGAHADVDLPSSENDSALVGTMPYMAPEQWGADEIDHRTDVWAVGLVLFEMLAGKHPLAPVTRDRLMEAALRLDEPMPVIVEPIDRGLAGIVARCLAKRKSDRYEDAAELVVALERYLPRRAPTTLETAPYPGLTPFREQDADLFFGRRSEIARLVALLEDRPLAAVVGASGAGKSSLVRAGVIPHLKHRATWDVVIARPGRQPLQSLALAVSDASDDGLASRLLAEPGQLGEILRLRAKSHGGRGILFVDQFEELYTLGADHAVRRAYLACLQGAADDSLSPIRVVISLRSDFLDRVAEDTAFIAALTPGIVFLASASPESLRAALVEPAHASGYRFESAAIADEMVAELSTTAGALPLLQFGAAQLWDERDRDARVLTRASYQRIGGVIGALASHADSVIAGMTPAAQDLARRVFQRLVTPEHTRDVVEIDDLLELGEPGATRAVIDHMVAARLLAIRSGTGAAVVELVHESLIDKWPALRRWLDHSQEDAAFLARLRGAARQWDDGRRTIGLLWRGDAEQAARTWSRGYRGELGRREQAYLAAVFRFADRSARIRRTAIAGTITFLAVLVVAAVVALIWIRNAETSAINEAARARAETERARAANDQLQAEKQRQLELNERLVHETREREAARATATEATKQVETSRGELVRVNEQLRAALARTEAESQHARLESERAVAESERARREAEAALEARRIAEELARKERERADRRGKISTKLP